jgi:hypothetical protein
LLESRLAPAVFVVTTTLDTPVANLSTGQDASGQVSLRSAIQAANSTSGGDTIELPAGTFTLTRAGAGEDLAATGDLDLLHDVTLQGAGGSDTIVDANHLDRAFDVANGVNVELDDLAVMNGQASDFGGGIRNAGSLTLDDVILSNNTVQGRNSFGGGIYNTGTLDIDATTISNNQALGTAGSFGPDNGGGGGGGGMGAGGGMFNDGGTVTITASTFASNTARGGNGQFGANATDGFGGSGGGAGGFGGGGTSIGSGGTGGDGGYGGGGGGGGSATIGSGGSGGFGGFGGGGGGGGSAFGSNGNGGQGGSLGGMGGAGGLTLSGSEGGGGGGGAGAGGGLYNRAGSLSLTNVTVSDNTAAGGNGGGVSSGTGASPGQGGDGAGGGIFVEGGTATLLSVTVAGNSTKVGAGGGNGGGVNNYGGTLNFQDTILADNSAASGPDGSGQLTSQGHNLIGDSSGASILGITSGNITGTDPLLAALADNGGPTPTRAIDSSSVAVDAGDGSAPSTDQRGLYRVGAADIGAFEFNPFVVTNTNDSGPGSLRDAITAANSAYGPVTITFQIGEPGSVQTIKPLDIGGGISLPVIVHAMTIDGWSQGGPGYMGPPLIVLDGTNAAAPTIGSFGLNIQSSDVTVQGLDIVNYANVNGNGFGIGVFSPGEGETVAEITIQGNYIGTDVTGKVAQPNGQGGIWIGPLTDSLIIGSNGDGIDDPQERNVISGNGGEGILLQGTGVLVTGNFIGAAADQSSLGNQGPGVIVDASDNTVGENSLPGVLSNLIAFNAGAGVAVVSGVGNSIQGNDFFNNAGGGIDLGNDGRTPNDAGDADTGPNELQNFPVFSDATLTGSNLSLTVTVPTSVANASYPLTIDFYKALDGNSGFQFIGSGTYTVADAQNPKTFVFSVGSTVAPDNLIVATATDADSNTSEFSAPIKANVPPTNLVLTPSASQLNEGDTLQLGGSFTDPNAADTHTVTINWGDSSGVQTVNLAAGVTNFSVQHAYTNDRAPGVSNGQFPISVQVTDGLSNPVMASTTVHVLNVAPTETLVGGVFFLGVDQPFQASVVLFDPGSDLLSNSIDYGDGTVINFISSPRTTVPLQHQYASEGSYLVTVKSSDGQASATPLSFYVNVFVAAPESPGGVGGTFHILGDNQEAGQFGDGNISLTRSPLSRGSGFLIFAQLPNVSIPDAAQQFLSSSGTGDSLLRVGTFDIREINLTDFDSATITIDLDTVNNEIPALVAINPKTGEVSKVVTSKFATVTQVPQRIGTNRVRITLVFDATSTPGLADLVGTIFTFAVAQPSGSGQTQTTQSIQLVTNNANDPATGQTQLEVQFQRSGFSGGNETLLAAAPSGSGIDVGGGGEPTRSDTAFVADMMADSLRAYSQDTSTSTDQPNPGPVVPQPPAGQEREESSPEALDSVFADSVAAFEGVEAAALPSDEELAVLFGPAAAPTVAPAEEGSAPSPVLERVDDAGPSWLVLGAFLAGAAAAPADPQRRWRPRVRRYLGD